MKRTSISKLAFIIAASTASLALVGCNESDNDDDSNSVVDTGTGTDTDIQVNNPDIGGGKILFYNIADNTYIGAANVGNLPDMVKFVDATTLVSANEGEPNDDYSEDPQGSVSIITLQDNKSVLDVTTLTFNDEMLEGNVRIKPGSNASVDLEPEYVAVSADGSRAWVSLQENNALAIVNLTDKSIEQVKGLGEVVVKDQKMDISADDVANPVVSNPDNIFALPMPDTIVSYSVDGVDYVVTANEGDDREYDGYEDLEKANKLDLSAQLEADVVDADLGMKKLRVLTDLGDEDGDGTYESLYMTGTRSFSIYSSDGTLVFDSGADFEEEIATNYADYFNTRVDDVDYFEETDPDYADSDFKEDFVDENKQAGVDYEVIGDKVYFWEGVDARSLKKGGEPEALAVQTIGNKVFAYIGLEKQGGFFVYDVTTPTQPSKVQYFNDIDYTAVPSEAGDLAPEGMVTFEQDGGHYLAVAHELSSTIALFELADTGVATKLASISLGSFDEGASEIVDYDPATKQLFVTNAETKMVDIINVSNPNQAAKSGSVDFSEHASSLQSVSVKDGVLAIAVE